MAGGWHGAERGPGCGAGKMWCSVVQVESGAGPDGAGRVWCRASVVQGMVQGGVQAGAVQWCDTGKWSAASLCWTVVHACLVCVWSTILNTTKTLCMILQDVEF